MPKVRPRIIQFEFDPALAAQLLDSYTTDDGRKLAECSKHVLNALADRLCHVALLCIDTAEQN